jgi:TolB-like protein
VHKKLDIAFESMGSQAMKNIADPVVAYRIRREDDGPSGEALPLPAKPSIAVLPFTSMSGEAEQETFADGLTEDLITDLSRNDGLFVIARNSTFAYKGKSVDARRIARELGVRYLLEGSARRAADRVRINVQLIDAIGGGHLWAERFDRGLEDVFAVQDEVTARIVGALVGKLSAPPPRSRPKNMEAFDLCARGRHLHELSPIAAREGFLLLERAIAIDPDYAEAHAWLALSHWIGWVHWGWLEAHHRRRAVEIAGRAVELDPNAACCRWIQGMLLAYESPCSGF